MDTDRSCLIYAAYKVSVNAFCHKRNHRCCCLAKCYKCCVKSHISINLILLHTLSPESFTASSYIPVRKLIYEIFKRSCCLCNLVVGKIIINSLNKSIKLRKNPFIHNWKLIILKCVLSSIEVINVSIKYKECICVPDSSHELSLSFCNSLIMESVRKPWC